MKKKAVVLLSGGLDSTTVLAIALKQGYEPITLCFDYGQRHRVELEKSRVLSRKMGALEHKEVTIDLRQFGGSALTDDIDVPKGRSRRGNDRWNPHHLRPGAEHHFPVILPGGSRSGRGWRIFSSASPPSTTPATPTADPNTSRPSSRWRTSPPKPGSKAHQNSKSTHH